MSKRWRKLAFAVGDTVNVARSMGAYSHRSGGVGKITAINPDGSYKLRYIAGGGRTRFEKAIRKGSHQMGIDGAAIPSSGRRRLCWRRHSCSPLPALWNHMYCNTTCRGINNAQTYTDSAKMSR